jgi:hypothetical protein
VPCGVRKLHEIGVSHADLAGFADGFENDLAFAFLHPVLLRP